MEKLFRVTMVFEVVVYEEAGGTMGCDIAGGNCVHRHTVTE